MMIWKFCNMKNTRITKVMVVAAVLIMAVTVITACTATDSDPQTEKGTFFSSESVETMVGDGINEFEKGTGQKADADSEKVIETEEQEGFVTDNEFEIFTDSEMISEQKKESESDKVQNSKTDVESDRVTESDSVAEIEDTTEQSVGSTEDGTDVDLEENTEDTVIELPFVPNK